MWAISPAALATCQQRIERLLNERVCFLSELAFNILPLSPMQVQHSATAADVVRTVAVQSGKQAVSCAVCHSSSSAHRDMARDQTAGCCLFLLCLSATGLEVVSDKLAEFSLAYEAANINSWINSMSFVCASTVCSPRSCYPQSLHVSLPLSSAMAGQ